MRRTLTALAPMAALLLYPLAARAEDPRELVPMSAEMRQTMLDSMQDHLVALDTILSHLATERYGDAAKAASERLTIAPFDADKAARIVGAMPLKCAKPARACDGRQCVWPPRPARPTPTAATPI